MAYSYIVWKDAFQKIIVNVYKMYYWSRILKLMRHGHFNYYLYLLQKTTLHEAHILNVFTKMANLYLVILSI